MVLINTNGIIENCINLDSEQSWIPPEGFTLKNESEIKNVSWAWNSEKNDWEEIESAGVVIIGSKVNSKGRSIPPGHDSKKKPPKLDASHRYPPPLPEKNPETSGVDTL